VKDYKDLLTAALGMGTIAGLGDSGQSGLVQAIVAMVFTAILWLVRNESGIKSAIAELQSLHDQEKQTWEQAHAAHQEVVAQAQAVAPAPAVNPAPSVNTPAGVNSKAYADQVANWQTMVLPNQASTAPASTAPWAQPTSATPNYYRPTT
jgi:hypothetical protein